MVSYEDISSTPVIEDDNSIENTSKISNKVYVPSSQSTGFCEGYLVESFSEERSPYYYEEFY